MAYDLDIAARIRRQLARRKNVVEKKMFGGICFLLDGHMCCGVLGSDVIVRVGAERAPLLLKEKHARVFDFTGKPSRNMLYVGPKAVEKDTELKKWVQESVKYAASLPPKH